MIVVTSNFEEQILDRWGSGAIISKVVTDMNEVFDMLAEWYYFNPAAGASDRAILGSVYDHLPHNMGLTS